MASGQGLQCIGSQRWNIQCIPKGGFDAIIIAVGVGAGFRGAFTGILQTDFVLGSQGDAAKFQ